MGLSVAEGNRMVDAGRRAAVRLQYDHPEFLASSEAQELLDLKGDDLCVVLQCIFEDLGRFVDRILVERRDRGWEASSWFNLDVDFHGLWPWMKLIGLMLREPIDLGLKRWTVIFESLGRFSVITMHCHRYMPGLLRWLEWERPRLDTSDERFRRAILTVGTALARTGNADEQRAHRFLARLLAECGTVVEPGEAWADRVLTDLQSCQEADRERWSLLLEHCAAARSAAPSAKWTSSAGALLGLLGQREFIGHVPTWLPLIDQRRSQPMIADWRWQRNSDHYITERNQDTLRGLCWLCATVPDPRLARALGRVAISAYRKVPGVGPRAVKVGNAAVYALGQMPGRDALGQLAMLRVKVKFGTAQKGIEKALTAAAAREGLPRDEIDELGVPSYGLTEVGKRREPMGDYTAELIITGIGKTDLRFLGGTLAPRAAGARSRSERATQKTRKPVPAALKTAFADELKDLKAAAKDIGAMLPAQRDRIDALFLENKTWPLAAWRERYLDHPLVGVLARRLIWRIGDGTSWTSAAWLDDANGLVGVDGRGIAFPCDDSAEAGHAVQGAGTIPTASPGKAMPRVRLWHPIEVDQAEVLAWRRFFEDRQIRQPFKQAHREVYLLTDAERQTEIYSNRFAAHILRQHQFHALCGVRNWKNKLRLFVDAEFPPATRWLPAWNLRAEFWIDGAGEEMNEAGAYLYLATDQVRFYDGGVTQTTTNPQGGGFSMASARADAEARRLQSIPPLVFSEIMRDIDLFVGVASVGNNPQWQDGGPDGAYRDYWWGYSFGDLSQTGAGRRDLLERLVPRLRIAAACSLSGNFLKVKGSFRTYKIHLGSGNILMAPNDQYLCIVPGRGDPAALASGDSTVFLPFEGDRTLAIILSKAFMLADDETIKDPSIVSQIKRRR